MPEPQWICGAEDCASPSDYAVYHYSAEAQGNGSVYWARAPVGALCRAHAMEELRFSLFPHSDPPGGTQAVYVPIEAAPSAVAPEAPSGAQAADDVAPAAPEEAPAPKSRRSFPKEKKP